MTTPPENPEPGKSGRKAEKSRPRLRDGVMKRGNTWSYVVRVRDPETGERVGGFGTEDDAKAASGRTRPGRERIPRSGLGGCSCDAHRSTVSATDDR